MMLKSGGWVNGQYLTIVEQTAAYQVVRVDVPSKTGMWTAGYQYRTSVGVENFKRLREIREAHPR